jgi:fibro-slime domain-containing protein
VNFAWKRIRTLLALTLSAALVLPSTSLGFGAEPYESAEGAFSEEIPPEAPPEGEEGGAAGEGGAPNETGAGYDVWMLDALYNWAREYNQIFDPEELLHLPFESGEAKKAFYDKYSSGTWYLLDIVSSNPGSPFSEAYNDVIASEGDSAAYLVRDSESGIYNLIAISKDGHSFKVHIESGGGKYIKASVASFSEALAEEPPPDGGAEALPPDEDAEPALEPSSAPSEEAARPDEAEPAGESAEPDPEESEEPASTDGESAEPASENGLDFSEGPAPEIGAGDSPGPPPASEAPEPEGPHGTAEPVQPEELEQASETPSTESEDPAQTEALPDAAQSEEAEQGADSEPAGGEAVAIQPEAGRTESSDSAEAPPWQEQAEQPAGDSPPDGEPDPDEPAGNALDIAASAILSLFESTAYGAELPAATSPQSLEAEEADHPPGPPPLDGGAPVNIIEEAALETLEGESVDIVIGEAGKVAVASIEIASKRILRAVAPQGTQPTLSDVIGKTIVDFPVNLYDYEGTIISESKLVGNQEGLQTRYVYEYETGYYNFNYAMGLARLENISGKDVFMYRGSPLSSYFMFNSLYMPKVPAAYNLADLSADPVATLARQNVDYALSNDGRGLLYNDGVTLGIAQDQLAGGSLKLNFNTVNNMKLFPAISRPEAKEIFIYGDDLSGDDMAKSSDGFQTVQNIGQSMMTAYPGYKFPFIFEDGYYVFDSSQNHVHISVPAGEEGEYDGDDKKLVLHSNSPAQVNGTTGGFFPFNSQDGINIGEVDYNFGMSMERTFMIPEKESGSSYEAGQVLNSDGNKANMIFEFSGDDDVWVYIDDKLALDLGGTHEEAYGSIDFTTGDIRIGYTVEADDDDEAIAKAGKIYKINDYTRGTARDAQFDAQFNAPTATQVETGKYHVTYLKGNLYTASPATPTDDCDTYPEIDLSDPTKVHKFNMYYVERSPEGSNCFMRFNLPMALYLLKETSGFDENDKFAFKAEIVKGNVITETVQPITMEAGKLTNVPLDSSEYAAGEELLIRITEIGMNPGQDQRCLTRYRSTLDKSDLGSSAEGAANDVPEGFEPANEPSLWYEYTYGTTGTVICLNYASAEEISLEKLELDKPKRTVGDISFRLEKETEDDDFAPVQKDDYDYIVTTDVDDGVLQLNGSGDPALEPGATYRLVEIRDANSSWFEPMPYIYFDTTDGLNPKIKSVYQYKNDVKVEFANPIDSTEVLDGANGLYACASEDGKTISVFNKRVKGSIKVTKEIEEDRSTQSKGDPIFIFQVAQYEPSSHEQMASWEKAVTFKDDDGEPKEVIFEGLDAGYDYVISELNTMRYGLDTVAVSGGDFYDDLDGNAENASVKIKLGQLDTSTYQYSNLDAAVVAFKNNRVFNVNKSAAMLAENKVNYKPAITPQAPEVITVRFWDEEIGSGTPDGEIEIISGDYIVVPESLNQDMNKKVSYDSTEYRPFEPFRVISESSPVDVVYNLPNGSSSGPGGDGNGEAISVYVFEAVDRNGSTVHIVGHIEYLLPGDSVAMPGARNFYVMPKETLRPALDGAQNDGTVEMKVGGNSTQEFNEYAFNYPDGTASNITGDAITYEELKDLDETQKEFIIFYKPLTVYAYKAIESIGDKVRLQREIVTVPLNSSFSMQGAEKYFLQPEEAYKLWLCETDALASYIQDLANGWIQMHVDASGATTSDFDEFATTYYKGRAVTSYNSTAYTADIPYADLVANANSNNECVVFYRENTKQINKYWAYEESSGNNYIALGNTGRLYTVYANTIEVPIEDPSPNLLGVYLLEQEDLNKMQSYAPINGGWSGNNGWIWYRNNPDNNGTKSFDDWIRKFYPSAVYCEKSEGIAVINDYDPGNIPLVIFRLLN